MYDWVAMKLLFDFFPVILFFAVYKLYGQLPAELVTALNGLPGLNLTPGKASDAIYLATAVAIVSSFLQVGAYWLRHRHFEKMHLVSLGLITVLGGATLFLHDPLFIKWKPTLVNWMFGLAFLISHYVGSRPLIQRLMNHAISVPDAVWRRLSHLWIGFFFVSGLANLAVAYTMSEAAWVNFKLFGMLGLTVIFILAQAIYLARHMENIEGQT